MVLDDLILRIYDVVTRDDGLQGLLVDLAGLFDCQSAALFYMDPRHPEANITMAYGPLGDPDVQARYHREFAALDPAPQAMSRLQLGRVATTDELFKDRLDIYRRFLDGFYYPIGLYGALGGPIASKEGQVGMVAVQRGIARAPFGADDIALLERLTPHLAKAIELRQTFFALRHRSDALQGATDTLGIGMMIFVNGRLSEANLAARAILARRDGLALDQAGRLTGPDGRTSERLRSAIQGAEDFSHLSIAQAGGRSYALRIQPIATGGADPAARRCAVLVCDPDHVRADAGKLLIELYRMSAQSAELTIALLKGLTLEEFAAERGLSRNTAKFHLKTAFKATGSRRQADLVRRVGPLVNSFAEIVDRAF